MKTPHLVSLGVATMALLGTPALAAPAPAAASTACVDTKVKAMSIELKDVALSTCVALLAKKAHFSYVFDREVNPNTKVTVRLEDVGIAKALEIILESQGMTCTKKGGIVVISHAKPTHKIALDLAHPLQG